ncbi:MAG TPA: tetratricopeptide repeat-containing serine/threonine protein kinase [Verrucomicrobiota bacterium]|nr:tetratricopeptide repeat-containing serine/threonine protein kinase [Verrucomicrobiota bacterium]
MNPGHPSEAEIFDRAAELSGEARAAYLAQACAGDDLLRRRVENLLASLEDADAGAFMGQSPAASAKTLLITTNMIPVTEKAGDKIGRYKLREQIGEGGCGVVYVAEQEEPVRRRVALKVIKLGMDTKQVVARFEAERQALALMDHPNIAKVLDAGATDTGRPYFVMELVRGIKITDYCDQNKVSTEERLKLFIQVCSAIQHAHQKGIIHRDIKPSNILVTLHDGVPVPKVIDFGIAKATSDQRLTDKTIYTAFEQFIGTPAYMSPEQAEMSGLDIDTRSDIYSLGVLLYELLTGRTPFDASTLLKAGLDQMRKIIREQEPQRPSTRLSTLEDADLTAIAQHRRSEAPKLLSLIRGDLDWIVMKSLEKDRTRRYETANGLALDIQRHLASEPVVARPPTTLYQLQKFIRRNKLASSFAVAVSALLVLGVTIMTNLYLRAERMRIEVSNQKERAEDSERQAISETAVSEAVITFIQEDLLQQVSTKSHSNWRQNTEGVITMREALDRASAKVGTRFKEQPLVEARIRDVIGWSYVGLEMPENAIEHLKRSVEIKKSQELDADEQLINSLNMLGLAYMNNLTPSNAIPVLELALFLKEKNFGTNHPRTWVLLNNLTLARWFSDNSTNNLANMEKMCGMFQIELGLTNSLTLGSMRWLATAYAQMGRHPEAISMLEAVVNNSSNKAGTKGGGNPRAKKDLAHAYMKIGKQEVGLKLLDEAVEECNQLLETSHTEDLGIIRDVADGCVWADRATSAIHLLEKCLAKMVSALPQNHPSVMQTRQRLASYFVLSGQRAEAAKMFEDILKIRTETLGNKSLATLETMDQLAQAYTHLGRTTEALAIFKERLAILESEFPDNHREILNTRSRIGWSLLMSRRLPEAIWVLENVFKQQVAMLGTNHVDTHWTMGDLAFTYQDAGRAEEAISLLEANLAFQIVHLGRENSHTLFITERLLSAYEKTGRESQAAKLRDQLAVLKKPTNGSSSTKP